MREGILPPVLARRATEGRLAHAYLLCGGDDAALERMAGELAAGYLCQGVGDKPCGVCKSCQKLLRGVHPDVRFVEKPADKAEFPVSLVREIRADAYIRPNESSRKIYIFRRAQEMNESAQNAFLKVLEEGPEYAVFLLLSVNDLALLPTVRSRCETVRLSAAIATRDSEVERMAGELAGLLIRGERWRMLEWCVSVEKQKREETLALWEATRQALLVNRKSGEEAKTLKLAQTLREMCDQGKMNVNLGVLWGRLWAAG